MLDISLKNSPHLVLCLCIHGLSCIVRCIGGRRTAGVALAVTFENSAGVSPIPAIPSSVCPTFWGKDMFETPDVQKGIMNMKWRVAIWCRFCRTKFGHLRYDANFQPSWCSPEKLLPASHLQIGVLMASTLLWETGRFLVQGKCQVLAIHMACGTHVDRPDVGATAEPDRIGDVWAQIHVGLNKTIPFSVKMTHAG